MDIRFASVVNMLLKDNGAGHKNGKILQGVRESYNLPHRCAQVSAKTKQKGNTGFKSGGAVLRNGGLGAHGIQQADVGQVVAASDIKEAKRRAMQLSNNNIRSEEAKFAHERNPDRYSLEAVGILKQATNKEDK